MNVRRSITIFSEIATEIFEPDVQYLIWITCLIPVGQFFFFFVLCAVLQKPWRFIFSGLVQFFRQFNSIFLGSNSFI